MDLRLNEQQQELQLLARRVAADVASASSLQPLCASELSGLLVPETHGGSGAGMVEGVLLGEELGRALVPGFVVSTVLVAPQLLALIASATERDALAGGIVSGDPAATVVAEDLAWPPARQGLVWGWHRDAVVVGPGADGMHILAGRTGPGRPTADPGVMVAEVNLQDAAPRPADDSASWFIARVSVLLCALLVGQMDAALALAVDHANAREQFGVKIGTFQAVKHLCADIYVAVESSRSATYAAAAAVEEADDAGEAARAAAVAKSWCGEAAVDAVEAAIQVHGGIGFTWDLPLHRYLRAAQVVRASFLGPAAALDLVAEGTPWS